MESGTRRAMTPARLKDGRIAINNAIAQEDELMAEIDQWGEVAAIIVPNAFYRRAISGHGDDIVGDDNGRGAMEKLRGALKSFD